MKRPVCKICFIPILLLCLFIYPLYCFSMDNKKDNTPDNTTDKTINLKASLDKNTVKAGSIFNLTLSFNLPKGATINKPIEVKGLEGFTIVKQHIYPAKIIISLFASQPGLLKTGEISFSYLDKDQKKQVLTAKPISLKVSSNLGDNPLKAQLRPIQGIIPTRPLLLKYWPLIFAFIVVLIAGFLMFRWYKIYKQRKLILEYSDPPHIRARKDIEELEAKGLFEKGNTKEFYFRFSEIIKRYLENIRGFPAAEYTTEEIMSRIDNEKDRQILPLLRHSDLVKFADSIPIAVEKEEEVAMAIKYIEETAPVYETKDIPESNTGIDK
ncbi:MAG: hypothetical protein ABIK92_18985 [Pseudomonadota bacterium]